MGKIKDMTGKTFGRLTVIEMSEPKNPVKSKQKYWKCICDCGKEAIVSGYELRSGSTVSCGCYNRELVVKRSKKYIKFDTSGKYGIGTTNNDIKFLFDLEDFDAIKNLCWYISYYGYVVAHNPKINKSVFLHRFIFNCKKGDTIDHINRNKLDNRKENLRIVSQSKNVFNSPIRSNNTTGVTGVTIEYIGGIKKYRSQILKNYKHICLGRFEKFNDAVRARKDAEIKYFGEELNNANS